MAVREELVLDLGRALSQLDDLERQLDGLLQPIEIPVEIETDQALDQLRRDIRAVDNDDIDVDVDTGDLSQAERELREMQDDLARTADEAHDFQRQMDRAGDEAESLGRRGKRAFSGLGTAIGALAVTAASFIGIRELTQFFGGAIDAASDLEESTSKAEVVFGEFNDAIQNFASTAPQALGLANQEALEFTATFGNLFTALGFSQQAAADLSPQIVQLGADLASFNNIEVTDALEKLRSGLVGEAEPLRALGVNINAATTQAKALELGLVGANGELSEAAKVQARYALILEQTATAQGDFARTSDSIANQQRTLSAEFESTKAAIGQALVPAFQTILDIAPSVITAIEQGLVPALTDLGTALGEADTEGFTTAIAKLPSAFSTVFGSIGDSAGFLFNTFQGLGDLLKLDFSSALDQFRDAGADFDTIGDRLAIDGAVRNLITTINSGIDPLTAFNATLASLGDTDLSTEQLESLTRRLADIAGIDASDAAGLFSLIDQINAFGADAGFNASQIDIMTRVLLGLARDGIDPADVALRNLIPSIQQAGQETEDAAQQISQGFSDIAAARERLTTSFTTSGVADDISELFDQLPTNLDAAQAALKDSEGEIVEDFSQFLDNLAAEIAAQQAFESNRDILKAMGLDNLAQVFTDAGLPAAQALADAVANPEEAQRAEDMLVANAESQAAAYQNALATAIARDFPTIDLTVPANITAAIQSLTVQGLDADRAVGIVGAAGAGPNIGGGVTINQTFETTPGPDTNTARAAQSAAAIAHNLIR